MTRLILLLYPRAWRERYGAELLDLMAAEGQRPSDLLDLARGAIRARLEPIVDTWKGHGPMTIQPAWRHPTAWAVAGLVLLLPTALFVAGSLAAFQFGALALQAPMAGVGAAVDGSRSLVVLLLGAPALAIALATLPLLHLRRDPASPESVVVIGIRLRRLNIAVITAALATGAALLWYAVGEMLVGAGA